MENKFEKDNGNMNNENKADKIANFLYNMNCGLTRKEKKLKKEKVSQTRIEAGKKQKMSKGKKITLISLLVLVIFMIVGGVALFNAFKYADYYNELSEAMIASAMAQSRNLFGNIASGIIGWFFFGLEYFIIKILIRCLIMPIASIIDAFAGIIMYFVNGGVLMTFGRMIFFEGPNTIQTTFITIFTICIGVFFISIIMSSLRQIVFGQGDYGTIFKNIVKSGFFVFVMFAFPLILYFFTTLVADAIITTASGGENFRFSMIILLFCQTSSPFFGGSNSLSLQPADIDDIYNIATDGSGYDLDSIKDTWGSDSIGYTWWSTSNKYANNMTGEEFIHSFTTDDSILKFGTEMDLYEEAYAANALDWSNRVIKELGNSVNLFLFVIAIVITGIILLMIVMQLFLRAIQIVGLFMIGPWTVAITPYDGGEKFGEWRKNIFDKFMQLILFCILYTLYITLLIENVEFGDDWKYAFEDENNLVTNIMTSDFGASLFRIICLVGGAYAVTMLPATFAGIVGGLTALAGMSMMRSAVRKGTKLAVGAATSGASSAAMMINGVSGGRIGNAIGGAKEKFDVASGRNLSEKIKGRTYDKTMDNVADRHGSRLAEQIGTKHKAINKLDNEGYGNNPRWEKSRAREELVTNARKAIMNEKPTGSYKRNIDGIHKAKARKERYLSRKSK